MKRRSYKYRIYPNKTQIQLLSRFFGSKRFVWNTCLAWRSNIYKEFSESVTGIDFSRELTELKKLESYSWLKDTPTTVYSQALRDQDAAFRKFFKEGAGYPRFKSRHQLQSIRFQLDQRVIVKYYKAGELLKIPGLGQIIICPLTTWEMSLHNQSGYTEYSGTFITHWLGTLLYRHGYLRLSILHLEHWC